MKSITVALLCSLTIANAVILKLGPQSEVIEGSYIVKLKDNINPDTFIAAKTLRRNNGRFVALKSDVKSVYTTVIKGFAAQLDESELNELNSMSEVEYIEPDQVMSISATVEQSNADWGLARHSSKGTLSGSSYTYRYDSSGGGNARVYVIDTGILVTHNEFGGRAITGANFITGETNTDLNGHGTHCAGTVGSATYGVAKNATLIGVKVLSASGSGSTAGVISGIEWAANDANNYLNQVSVISLSLGGGYSAASNAAVAGAVQSRTAAAVAAGNSGANACNYSPASEPSAITVVASNLQDQATSWTNFGTCTDIIAPGNAILSTYIGSNTATATLSGTSMATPHVAGLLAYIGTLEGIVRDPERLEARLKALALPNAIPNAPTGTPNLLAQNELSN